MYASTSRSSAATRAGMSARDAAGPAPPAAATAAATADEEDDAGGEDDLLSSSRSPLAAWIFSVDTFCLNCQGKTDHRQQRIAKVVSAEEKQQQPTQATKGDGKKERAIQKDESAARQEERAHREILARKGEKKTKQNLRPCLRGASAADVLPIGQGQELQEGVVGVLEAEAHDEAVDAGAEPWVVRGAHPARDLIRQGDKLVARHLEGGRKGGRGEGGREGVERERGGGGKRGQGDRGAEPERQKKG